MPKRRELEPAIKNTTFSTQEAALHINDIGKFFRSFAEIDKVRCLEALGMNTEFYTCQMCGKLKPKSHFYKTTDPNIKTGYTHICKECAEDIACPLNAFGEHTAPTKETVQEALRYLDKPFISSLWDSSIAETTKGNHKQPKTDAWTAYIKNISMMQYNLMRWKDSDIFTENGRIPVSHSEDEQTNFGKEIKDLYEANKKMVIHNLGYDPFETMSEADKPLAYSKLANFLDESTAEDELKLSSVVEIVQSVMQSERINKTINEYQSTPSSLTKNAAIIKSLAAIKKDTLKSALDLAKDNGISLKYSGNNTKGANTVSGIIKKLKEMNLREQEVNSFDIGTSEGMRQVAEISDKAILSQLSLDDNDYTEIISNQRKMVTELNQKCDAAQEEARLLKRENSDLKQYMKEQNLLDDEGNPI